MDDEIELQSIMYPILASLILLWSICRWYYKPAGMKNPPPSPLTLPIIGNLHQLGSLLHQNLRNLARNHGQVMLLHFGSVPVLVVSSASAAHEITRTHDLTFAGRPQKNAMKISYNGKNVVFAPQGEHWRRAKSIFVLQLLSSKRVQSYRSIRVEETALLVEKIRECSDMVNLSEMVSEFTNDVICRSAFGRKYSSSETGKKFIELLGEVTEVVGTICVGEFIPWLGWIDRVRGIDERVDRVARELDEFLEGVMQERIENGHSEFNKGRNGDSFLDILLEIYNDQTGDVSVDRECIKGLLLDAFGAGTDTTSVFLDWAMAELLRNPAVMLKLQREVKEIAEANREITDTDLERMQYLKAVIKEVLRLHPPAPFLIPRVATKDVEIKGYGIPAGTMVMVNVWAIGRDPASWDEPEKFKPERFLDSSVDFKGLSSELLPFGAGRRVCPGIAFAVATTELVLANLVQKFDWKLADGAEAKGMDMSERAGVTVRRAVPLLVVASQRKSS